MLIRKFLIIAATCLSLSSQAGNGPTYIGFYDCGFAAARFEIAHNNMDVAFSLNLKWANGTNEIVVEREEEEGPWNTTQAFYWTIRDMTFRTALDEGWVPDVITVFSTTENKACELIKRETIDDRR